MLHFILDMSSCEWGAQDMNSQLPSARRPRAPKGGKEKARELQVEPVPPAEFVSQEKFSKF